MKPVVWRIVYGVGTLWSLLLWFAFVRRHPGAPQLSDMVGWNLSVLFAAYCVWQAKHKGRAMTKPLKDLYDWYNFVFMRRGMHSGGNPAKPWHYENKCSMEFCDWPDPKTRGEWLAEAGFHKERRGILRQRTVWVPPRRT